MNKFAPLPANDLLDRIIADAVRHDMARVYNERREEPREAAPPSERPSIFMRRQAE